MAGARIYHKRHSDEDVKFWAEVYTELGITLEEIEQELGISHSTAWWCFMHRLADIDYDLYKEVMFTMTQHKSSKKRKEVIA